MKKEKKTIVPESVSQHIEEQYKKSREFRKAYDEEVLGNFEFWGRVPKSRFSGGEGVK